MMKNKNLGYGFLAILFVLLSAIAFVIPTEKTGTFWVAYIFTGIAIAAQIVIWKNAFGKGAVGCVQRIWYRGYGRAALVRIRPFQLRAEGILLF